MKNKNITLKPNSVAIVLTLLDKDEFKIKYKENIDTSVPTILPMIALGLTQIAMEHPDTVLSAWQEWCQTNNPDWAQEIEGNA